MVHKIKNKKEDEDVVLIKEESLAYLPKILQNFSTRLTLVVDLDETLIHYAEIPDQLDELRVRPYVQYFLNELSKFYEIVIFTAAVQEVIIFLKGLPQLLLF